MSKALIAGINQVATDKGLDREVVFEAIEAALISAYKRNYGSVANVTADVDRVTGEMRVFAEREVVEDVINERTEITLEDAQKLYPEAELGDVVKVETNPDDFGRIAAQTAKQVILQRIREAERDTVYENFAHRVGELINAQVRSVDDLSGAATLLIDDKHECLLMRDDQIRNETIRRGDYLKVYVVDVHKSTRGPVIKLSRTHRNLLRRLMEQEIPEVRDGVVEIKSIAREPGARSKASVVATVPGVDPVGSCVGMRGLRIQNIVNELGGEKIDVVEWSTDTYTYISNALSPAKVSNVLLEDSNSIKTATVIVPDRQLSLAIGKEGQNARLAAKLTGWRIDIKSESEATAEGLDKLIEEQAEAAMRASHDNLIAFAEEILRKEEQGSSADDKLREAAKQIEEHDLQQAAEEQQEVIDLPPLVELEEKAEPTEDMSRLFEEAAAAAMEEQTFIEEFPIYDAEAEAALLNLGSAEEEDEGEPEDDSVQEAEAAAEEEADASLPDVITADMLRSRERQSIDFESDDFEIPAELLVGLEDDELEEEQNRKAKSKSKAKAKPKKGKGTEKSKSGGKKWDDDDDQFSDLYR